MVSVRVPTGVPSLIRTIALLLQPDGARPSWTCSRVSVIGVAGVNIDAVYTVFKNGMNVLHA